MSVSLYSLATMLSTVVSNKRRVSALKSLGVVSIGDALTYFPFRVTDPVPPRAIREAGLGQTIAFGATVAQIRVAPMHARRGYRLDAVVDDGRFARSRGVTGAVAQLVFFSHRKSYIDWVAMRLGKGTEVVVSGQVSEFNGQIQFTHPDVLTIDPDAAVADQVNTPPATPPEGKHPYDAPNMEQALARIGRPRPVYHASARISSEHIHDTIMDVLGLLDTPIEDILPESVIGDRALLHRQQAFQAIHNPSTIDEFKLGIATLRYEEAFISQTAVVHSRAQSHEAPAAECTDVAMRDRFIGSLSFALTHGQREVIDTIAADMSREHPMQRLLQGEVGSGKTVVAVCAMLQAVGSGHQAVLIAPIACSRGSAHRRHEACGASAGAGAGSQWRALRHRCHARRLLRHIPGTKPRTRGDR